MVALTFKNPKSSMRSADRTFRGPALAPTGIRCHSKMKGRVISGQNIPPPLFPPLLSLSFGRRAYHRCCTGAADEGVCPCPREGSDPGRQNCRNKKPASFHRLSLTVPCARPRRRVSEARSPIPGRNGSSRLVLFAACTSFAKWFPSFKEKTPGPSKEKGYD